MILRHYQACVVAVLIYFTTSGVFATSPKILHLSFHKGCIQDFQDVANCLGLDVTSWYPLSGEKPVSHFDGIARGNEIYNISYERAARIWELHKDYFNQFDCIITSDTAPLSRIFLQNGWKKPLIIWICNRFDYYDGASSDGKFPDAHYYELFRQATCMSNVRIIGYTAYEHFYAALKGVKTDGCTIKPIGSQEQGFRNGGSSYIPESVNKEQTIFIYPRLEPHQVAYVQQECSKVGIPTYSGSYNGPADLKDFKGVIYFPYQWSNLALFEQFQQGVVHFVPSERFITQLINQNKPVRCCALDHWDLMEWYCTEHRPYIVYFDSWADLKRKITTVNYSEFKASIKAYGAQHCTLMLNRWREVFRNFGFSVA